MTQVPRPILSAITPNTATGSDIVVLGFMTGKNVGRPVLRTEFSIDLVDEGEVQKGSGEWVPNPTGVEDLLKGSLPKEQIEMLARSGYDDFVLGTNQSGIESVEDCADYLGRNGGVNFTGYGIGHRFMTFDSGYVGTPEEAYIKDAVVNGYYGQGDQAVKRGGFRIVGVFPLVDGAREKWGNHVSQVIGMVDIHGDTPGDLVSYGGLTSEGLTEQAISPKYIAGLVDDSGNYFMNPGFMQEHVASDIPAPVSGVQQ